MGADESTLGELVERLAAIGLEPKDAQLYLHLCLSGPTKASEAAAATKLNRTEAYRALDNLMRRGFVTASLDRPTLYEATAPEKVFDDALAHHVARRSQIERARESTLGAIEQMRKAQPTTPLKTSYKILQGRATIYTAVEAMVRRAQVRQRMASTFFAGPNATPANAPYMTTIERARAGLEMQMMFCEHDELPRMLGEMIACPNVQVRTFEPGHEVRMTIVDDREVLVWLNTDPSTALAAREDIAMWTNAPDFVHNQLALYHALWTRAQPLKTK